MRIYCISKANGARFVNLNINLFKSLNVFVWSSGMLDNCSTIHSLHAKLERLFVILGLKFYKQEVILLNVNLIVFKDDWKFDCLSVNKFERSHLSVLPFLWLEPHTTDWISILVSTIKVFLVLFFSKTDSKVCDSMIIIFILGLLIKMRILYTLKTYSVASLFRKNNWTEICAKSTL